MLGDTGVAVNPADEKYRHLVGKNAILPLVGRKLPIVADDYVELGFGTGAVKMTPCHDPNDYEVGLRHNLEQIQCIDEDAKIINGGKYDGMDRYEARKAIVADLEEQGYLVKVEPYSHNVGCCYRCGTVVEPLTSPQWFVKMEPLAKKAIKVVKDGRIKFVPSASRRPISTGWRMSTTGASPASSGGVIRSQRGTAPTAATSPFPARTRPSANAATAGISRAMRMFSTRGSARHSGRSPRWAGRKDTPELDYWYPTSVMVTGYDIIFFWVARMIFSAMEQMEEEPFKTVFIHGLVRDSQGRKMSKSLGNGIDPLEIIDKYGADALRFNLITGNSPGNDMRFYVEKCEAMRNFCNKIWNASRFVMMNLTIDKNELPEKLEIEDKWILSSSTMLSKRSTRTWTALSWALPPAKIYDFIWDSYCDWYIELTKPRLNGEDEELKLAAQKVLLYVLTEILKLLHPFMPFITEEIWQALPHDGEALMIARFPEFKPELSFPEDEQNFEMVMTVIKAVRARRSEMNVPPSRKAHLIIATDKRRPSRPGAAISASSPSRARSA